jgi:hypothetical protein
MRKKLSAMIVASVVVAAIGLFPRPASAAPIGYTRASVSGEDRIYSIDMATGAMTLLGNSGIPPATRALEVAADGTLYGSNAGNLYTFSTSTGAATLVGSHGCCSIMSDMAFAPDGRLLGISGNPSTLYEIDPFTGAATAIGPVGRFLSGISVSCAGVLYGSDGATDELLTLSTTTGAATAVGSFGFDAGSASLAHDSSDQLWALVRPANPPGTASRTFTVDVTTGAMTQVAASVAGNNPSDVALGPRSCQVMPTTSTTSTTATTTSTTLSSTTTAGGGTTTTTATTPAQPINQTPNYTG